MEYRTYKVTLTEQEFITLKTILEDTLHAGSCRLARVVKKADGAGESYEDAVIRGVIEQLTERYHHLKGFKE
jgi:hypothetical protein|tara:strand:+ start:114 stop:329 length:216 start_codon:yes stop_codon:yes gene_type:complete